MMFDGLLAVHTAAAVLAVLAAFGLALLDHKDRQHRTMAGVFALTMAVSLGAALAMAFVQPSLVLMILTLLSVYVMVSGWRAAKRRSAEPAIADRMFSGVVIGFGLLLVMASLTGMIDRSADPEVAAMMPVAANIILPALGVIGAVLAVQDVLEEPGRVRVGRHMARMLGALAATVTLVLVRYEPLSSTALPNLAHWIAPAAVTAPLIVLWIMRLRRASASDALARADLPTGQEALSN